jgi:ABC-type glycerol-3-phosphate transport system substrate-binding protein
MSPALTLTQTHSMPKTSTTGLLLFILFLTLGLSACQKKDGGTNQAQAQKVTLTFYGLFDNQEVVQPIIDGYEASHPNVTILYKKFTDPKAYMDLIVNELAEGEGPDLFHMHNTWLPKHYKKLSPAPETLVDPTIFRDSFIEVSSGDLIIPNDSGVERVWGMPLYVDTLALYYNDAHFEDAIPSQGAPSKTWDGIEADVNLLNKQDQSFERFNRSGIALGRGDNILRAFDVLLMLMMQYETSFYTGDYKSVLFGTDAKALSALNFFTSFGLPSQKNYSWNKTLADPESAEKEITTFAKGKTSMIFGYSYTYEDILNEINRLKQEGQETIDWKDVKIQEAPQIFDPETSANTRVVYASYFAPVVSRTSPHPEEAWDFLLYMISEENLRTYNTATHRPSALRSLIPEQSKDPIYGIFASQIGYADSLTMADADAYKEIFLTGISEILATAKSETVLKRMAESIQALIPSSGIKPTYVAPQVQTTD